MTSCSNILLSNEETPNVQLRISTARGRAARARTLEALLGACLLFLLVWTAHARALPVSEPSLALPSLHPLNASLIESRVEHPSAFPPESLLYAQRLKSSWVVAQSRLSASQPKASRRVGSGPIEEHVSAARELAADSSAAAANGMDGEEGEPALLPPDPELDGDLLLQRAVGRYQALREGPGAAMMSGPLLLAYTRKKGGRSSESTRHLLYRWSDDEQRLELRQWGASTMTSVSLLTSDAAWLILEGQRYEVNREELRQRLDAYSLDSLLKLQLELPNQVSGNFGASDIHYLGREVDSSGKVMHVIALAAANNLSPDGVVMMSIEADSYLLRGVLFRNADGLTEYRYEDFRVAFPGFLLPFRIELDRGGRFEESVTIHRLEVLAREPGRLLDPAQVWLVNGRFRR